MFTTIVAGTDANEKGRNAVAFAHELAWATGARLLLVAVHDHAPTQPGGLIRRLRALRNELAPGALALTVPDASPANALRRVADEQGADLIVIGARERGRVRRLIEGQPGPRILRGAPCAVAVVPDGALAPPRLDRIGVFADVSHAALDLAESVAHCSGARLEQLADDEDAEGVDVLVLGSRDPGEVRRLVGRLGRPVLVAARSGAARARSSYGIGRGTSRNAITWNLPR